ncbi:DUF748 domain-containing protein [Algibacter lectus]|uniref:Uncharacterized protein DUF748 n=1 Tax=Algibacter lectus TaxID=221126 RepID=A0A090VJV5_9FLAO|nr:DUF748 domain-containing protein [Algibacter lectus]MWW23317.1 DUF748 domain-containing protein [Algibacter lectus]TDY64009.1 uncharacterized protein DUF748 [Algibacter lectus]GAL63639.1 hypothetical protein JCM19300_2675 [Algibacter lectus]SFB84480.1 protein of unknown function [Algibacter lectus]
MEKKKNRGLRKKRYTIPVIIIGVLILFRILLPFMVKKYVNNVLADIPGYYGQVSDIDISLFRGAYVIHNLYLNKIDAGSEVPFIKLAETDISIEWRSLLKGRVVSEIIMTSPQFIYVFEDQQKDEAADPDIDDWTKALTDLVPIDINNLKIIDGKAAFVQLTADPNIDLNLNQIQLNATNLRNVERTERELPSEINATAMSIGEGRFTLNGKMDLVKQIPDMDVSFSLEDASVTALNDFTNYYAGIDFAEGSFNVFSEIAIADGFLTGYVKPLLKDSKLISAEQDSFLNTLWEGFVGFFKFVLKNKGNNTLATKVPLSGDLNQVKTKVWPSIYNVFKNGWIEAFKGVVDNDINFEDAEKASKKEDNKK